MTITGLNIADIFTNAGTTLSGLVPVMLAGISVGVALRVFSKVRR
jgi:hypothetical protein